MDATDKDPSAKATLARLPALDSGLRYCPECGELEAWCGCETACACCSARLEYATQTHCMSCDAYGCALGAPQCGQEEYGS